jgi:hypothetical protein
VLLSLFIGRSDSSGTNTYAFVTLNSSQSDYHYGYINCTVDGANFQQGTAQGTIYINQSRTIYYILQSYKCAGSYLYALAYRRVGTNT